MSWNTKHFTHKIESQISICREYIEKEIYDLIIIKDIPENKSILFQQYKIDG